MTYPLGSTKPNSMDEITTCVKHLHIFLEHATSLDEIILFIQHVRRLYVMLTIYFHITCLICSCEVMCVHVKFERDHRRLEPERMAWLKSFFKMSARGCQCSFWLPFKKLKLSSSTFYLWDCISFMSVNMYVNNLLERSRFQCIMNTN